MDVWCERDASWDCDARWCAVEKDGQDLYGWMVWKRCQLGLHQCMTVLDGAQWRNMVKIYMDGWCGRDTSWDCVNASDSARWCAVEKYGQDLYGWMVWQRCQLGLRQCIRRC